MKVWQNNYGWRDDKVTGFLSDDDGYCTCSSCQAQKKKEQVKKEELHIPEELFEL